MPPKSFFAVSVLILLLEQSSLTNSFLIRRPIQPKISTKSLTELFETEYDKDGNIKKNPLEMLMDPIPTKIPKELRDEIYKAEGNTKAARERTPRVILYTVMGVIFVSLAFINNFLSKVTEGAPRMSDLSDVEGVDFNFAHDSGLWELLLLNKFVGAFLLVTGAASGMMAESELNDRRDNAEKIYAELVRRKEEGKQKTQKSKRGGGRSTVMKTKSSSSLKNKRLSALSEMAELEESIEVEEQTKDEPVEAPSVAAGANDKDESFVGKVKGWYEKADQMAASQALLLNKELEDRGVLDKVTDETGLKVIGKEAAAKLKQEEKATTNSENKEGPKP